MYGRRENEMERGRGSSLTEREAGWREERERGKKEREYIRSEGKALEYPERRARERKTRQKMHMGVK